jgi:hypothetical protein
MLNNYGDFMVDNEDTLTQILKGAITDIMPQKDLVIEAVHELVRDEIKRYIRSKLDEDPALKKEIKDAINEYLSAKIREVNAALKLAKSGAKLGLNLIPEHLRQEVSKDIVNLFEKEMGEILERGL